MKLSEDEVRQLGRWFDFHPEQRVSKADIDFMIRKARTSTPRLMLAEFFLKHAEF